MTARQLLLPIGRRPARTPRSAKARRDFTPMEFAAALARNGFRQLDGGLKFVETTRASLAVFEGVTVGNPIRLRRRATLAKIIRERQREIDLAHEQMAEIAKIIRERQRELAVYSEAAA